MRILVIGGTRFVGRHLVAAALERDHDVTLFHRGRTGDGLFPEVDDRHGDRDTDLSALADGRWDATVDVCAYVPRQVDTLAQALDDRGGHHLLVSSVSAYDPSVPAGYTEDAPLATPPPPEVEEVSDATYGGLKVACERAAVAAHGRTTVLVRPTYVVGPHDYSWRFPWWVRRLAEGGEVLAPAPSEAPIQVIDARDMAAWMVGLLEQEATGAFHAASPPPPFSWRELLQSVGQAVAPRGTTLHWVAAERLHAAGLDGRGLPLWPGDDDQVGMMAADPTAAYATGLTPRPIADTAKDTLEWLRGTDAPPMPPGVGLDPEQEAELLGRR